MTSLFARFASTMRSLTPGELADPRSGPQLELGRVRVGGRDLTMLYAPFDHVNSAARLVIVGLTPGLQQARNALAAAQSALRGGASEAAAAAQAKVFASFSGPMRTNLVAMLDRIGVAHHLGVSSTALLWGESSRLVHFTSALRYPVFVNGENWSGQPDMLRDPTMREWLETWTGEELRTLPEALLVPLGPKAAAALHHLAVRGAIDASRILDGLPHPSGANAERVAYFVGRKPIGQLSSKTSPARLDAARVDLEARLRAI